MALIYYDLFWTNHVQNNSSLEEITGILDVNRDTPQVDKVRTQIHHHR